MKRLATLFLVLVMACGMMIGSAGAAPVTAEPRYGGSVTLYYPKFYNYFDPAMMDEYQFSFWFETLWVMDWGLNDPDTYSFEGGEIPIKYLNGQLAESWTFDPATGILAVKLVEGVAFHEGEPYNGREFKASDVEWSYSRLLGLNGLTKVETEIDWEMQYLGMLEDVKAIGDYTVEFTFKEGMRTEIAQAQMMNAKVNIAGPEWDTCAQDWTCAKGTGPYILEAYVPDNSMKFVRNESYYGHDERSPENQLPYIDSISLVYIAEAPNVLAQALSGALDWFGENGKDVLNAAEIEQLRQANVGGLYSYMSKSPAGIGMKVSQEPFSDINVRIAMQKAIDIELINSMYYNNDEPIVIPGLWSPALSEWSTAGTWSDELNESFAYDPEAAKQLLADAGYPDGFAFTIQCDPLVDLDLYTLAASYLAEVGITMNIETAPEMMEAVQVSQNPEDPRQFNGYAGGYGDYMLAVFMTGDGPMPNAYNHQDQTYLGLLDAMAAAQSEDERTAAARELDVYFPEMHWATYLSGMQPSYDFMSDRIGGYSGEKVYFRQNMRTIWARLWVEE